MSAFASLNGNQVMPGVLASLSTSGDASPATPTLYELYNSMFETVVADTDELIEECYKLRYKVYCVENPFLDPDPLRGEYEQDEHDGNSLHALLRYRKTGEFIGTVRLIIDTKDSPHRMPAIRLSEENHIFLPEQIYKQPCAEVSRFCISKEFRRRITDTMHDSAYTRRELIAERQRVIPYMALGLIKSVFDACKQHEMRQCCAVMEPSLIRLLDKLGIHFQPIGQPIEHHGTRQITTITNIGLYNSLLKERPEVLELMTDQGRSPLLY